MKQKDLYQVRGETLIISLPEELDHDVAGRIRSGTDGLFSGNRIRNVIFDYTNTYFMDSSGIGLVMGRYKEVHYLNGNVYIVGVNEKIRRILDISGLYRVAVKMETVEDAILKIEES